MWGRAPSPVHRAKRDSPILQSKAHVPVPKTPPPPTIYNSPSMNLGLKDRVALVAASSQGIGLATAEAFAAEGCRVAICARNQTALQSAAEQIRKQHHVEVLAEALDVTDAPAVSQFRRRRRRKIRHRRHLRHQRRRPSRQGLSLHHPRGMAARRRNEFPQHRPFRP